MSPKMKIQAEIFCLKVTLGLLIIGMAIVVALGFGILMALGSV